MTEITLNYPAILAAAAASMILGFIYYTPNVLGNTWMKLAGLSKDEMEKGKKSMGQTVVLALVGALVMAYVFAHVIDFSGARDASSGAQGGFWMWLGFVATTSAGRFLWEKKRPWSLWVLDNGYHLLNLIIMGMILGTWR